MLPVLFAIHVSDGVLHDPAWIGGWAVAAGLVILSTRKVTEEEIPRIGVLSAAVFVASQLHLPLAGVSVHLLLNGLAGVILGRRAPLAITAGLLLQALLFGHGGKTTIGLNVAVYSVPALLAGLAFPRLYGLAWLRHPTARLATVTAGGLVWLTTAGLATQWEVGRLRPDKFPFPADPAGWWVCDPRIATGLLLLSAGVGVLERRLEQDPNFTLGLLLGAGTSFLTVGLNGLVLWAGGKEEVRDLAGVVLLANLPVVAVESVGVGFVVAYLARAKPEWLAGGTAGQPPSGSTSSNGTSH